MGGTDHLPLAPWNGPAPGPTPYKPLSVPGRIEAEDYDLGGEGVATTTPRPATTAARTGTTTSTSRPPAASPNVGWIRNGEYLTYTVNVTTAGTYTVTARVASPNSGAGSLSVDGAPGAVLAVPNTGSFATFTTAARSTHRSPGNSRDRTVTPTPRRLPASHAPLRPARTP